MFNDILLKLFGPVIDFLKQEGVWDYIVKGYDLSIKIFTKLFGLIPESISQHITWENIIHWAIKLFKLIVDLFIALYHVLLDIFNWAQSAIK